VRISSRGITPKQDIDDIIFESDSRILIISDSTIDPPILSTTLITNGKHKHLTFNFLDRALEIHDVIDLLTALNFTVNYEKN